MARRNEPEVEEVIADVNDELEETAEVGGVSEGKAKREPKPKKEPARGELPEGYVTPVGLAKVLTEKKLHIGRDGQPAEIRAQMVYSYIKNAPKDHPFPLETVTDSLGKERQAVKVEAGVEWWEAKNERTAQRKANAAEKATKKAEKAKAAESADEAEGEANVEVVEAE